MGKALRTGWPLLAALLCCAGCSTNVAESLLAPTGERPQPAIGQITGRLEFGTGSYPQSLVLVARVANPGYTSPYRTIQVVGSFNNWDVVNAPRLTSLAPGVWVDTLSLPAGSAQWKFRTNDNWEEDGDFGSADPADDGLENVLDNPAGFGQDLKATVPADMAGLLVCTLSEIPLPARYRFQKPVAGSPAAFSSTVDGRFLLTGLVPGIYNVLVRPPGKPPVVIANVAVGTGSADLGVVDFGAGGTGAIRGYVAHDTTTFADLADPPYPPTLVELYQGSFLVTSQTVSGASRSFAFTALQPGDYRVAVSAYFFLPTSRNVTVGTAAEDLGALDLAFDPNKLSTQVHVVGDFNGFTFADSTAMGLVLPLVWQYTPSHPIAAGTYNLKFGRNGSWADPAYGGDESVVLTVPLTGQPTRLTTGEGTALRVQLPASGTYRFVLDERRQTFDITTASGPLPARARRP